MDGVLTIMTCLDLLKNWELIIKVVMMDDLISRQSVKDWLLRWEGYIDKDIIARMQYRVVDIPSAQPKPLKYSGTSICCYCETTDCDGCLYEPMAEGRES